MCYVPMFYVKQEGQHDGGEGNEANRNKVIPVKMQQNVVFDIFSDTVDVLKQVKIKVHSF